MPVYVFAEVQEMLWEIMKVTQREFKLFKAECLRYQKMLNLMDWVISITKNDLDGSLGRCTTRAANRVANISLCNVWPSGEGKSKGVELIAAHEMTHLFLATLSFLGECRYVTDSEIDLENERLAVVLERVLVRVK